MRLRSSLLFTLLLTSSPLWADPASPQVAGTVRHTVKQTDDIGTLSRLYGWSPEELRERNNGKTPATGDVLWIPPSVDGWASHTVLAGQTLQGIASGYGIPIEQLRQANDLSNDSLTTGQRLVLPRATKPQWKVAGQPDSRQRHSLASRSGQPYRRSGGTAGWTMVTLKDGRKGWVRLDALNFQAAAAPTIPSTPMAFGKRLNDSQRRGIHTLAYRLEGEGFQVSPDDIAVFMALETGGSFSPAAGHPQTGPVGLAQFTDVAIRDLNSSRPAHDQLSRERLRKMSFEEQCEVVGDYLSTAFHRKKMHGKKITSADLYAAIFCPRAIGLPLEAAVYTRDKDAGPYGRNSSLDLNNDGTISKSEMMTRMEQWSRQGEADRG